MLIRYFFHELSEEDERFYSDAIKRFLPIVESYVPSCKLDVLPLSDVAKRAILDEIQQQKNFFDYAQIVFKQLWENGLMPRLIVCSGDDSFITQTAKRDSLNGSWGSTISPFAAAYRREAGLVWHEMCHLLYAEDCYSVENGVVTQDVTCGHSNCLMQYVPTIEIVGDPPFLCSANIERISSCMHENS